jgi:hypothetical protein
VVAWQRRGSGPAAARAGGGVARVTVKGGGVGATRDGAADRWARMRWGPDRQWLGAA